MISIKNQNLGTDLKFGQNHNMQLLTLQIFNNNLILMKFQLPKLTGLPLDTTNLSSLDS